MAKRFISLLLIIAVIMTFSACSSKTKAAQNSNSKIQVLVSFNAMREFAEAVGKDKIEVTTMTPDGTEPHDFEPKAKDLENLSDTRIFVYNGLDMESWVDKSLEVVDNKNIIAVEASKGVKPIKNTDTDTIREEGQYDPHIWLSLKGAEIQARNIKDVLVKASPSDKDYFEKNYSDFYNELEKLFNDYNTKLSALPNKNFVTGHAAFAYLCRDFGLKQNSVEDVFAEGEPSAKKLKELIDYCKDNKIKTIFVEDMVSPKVSETLASQVGARTEKIHTLESSEEGKNYIQCMEDNLNKIYNSLK